MKVCVVSQQQTGGGFTFEMELLSALSDLVDESRHSFTVLASSNKNFDSISSYVRSPRLEISKLPKLTPQDAKNTRRIHSFTNYIRGLKDARKDNIATSSISHNQLELFANERGIQLIWFLGQVYENIPDVPYFATLWDLQHRLQPFFPEVGNGGIWEYREAGLSRYLRRATMIITGSKTAQAEIERFYQVPPERIKILPHPTPQFSLQPPIVNDNEVLTKYGISEGYLFYPAQFWPHKNHINLLYALHFLREHYGLLINMVFVGTDTGNKEYVQQMIDELNLSSQVNIIGFVLQTDLIALYRKAFALTYLTFFGPDNLPPLEAFALGCPVIASNVSGAHEQLKNAALLVNPNDPQKIAQAILQLHTDQKLRISLVQRGRKLASSWNNHDFIRGVFETLDDFEKLRRCWI